jgi:hypothetical protein
MLRFSYLAESAARITSHIAPIRPISANIPKTALCAMPFPVTIANRLNYELKKCFDTNGVWQAMP